MERLLSVEGGDFVSFEGGGGEERVRDAASPYLCCMVLENSTLRRSGLCGRRGEREPWLGRRRVEMRCGTLVEEGSEVL